MLGYYTFGGDGGMQWRSGYQPGQSPDDLRERRYAQRKAKPIPENPAGIGYDPREGV